MMFLSDDKQADVIDAFNTTSRYLDDILNINNVYFGNMVSQIYPSEIQLNKANTSDTEAAFLDLHLSISNDIVSTKIYDKRDDFDFEIVNFLFLDGDVPRSTSYGVYIAQLIRFAKASSHVADFNTRNKLLTQKLLKQGYRYHKLRKTFSKFYRRYYDLISKFQIGLESLLCQGVSELEFYGDLHMHIKFHQDVMRYRGLSPFDCTNLNYFFCPQSSPGSQLCNVLKLILNIYDHRVAMHCKFHQGVISYRGVIAF